MKRWGKLNPVRFDEKELKTDLGAGNYIFVGSSCDMWAENIPDEWIHNTLAHCKKFVNNKYFFQTKDVKRIYQEWMNDPTLFPNDFSVCTTIETNRYYPEIMRNSPDIDERVNFMNELYHERVKNLYVTVEPIMDFGLDEFKYIIETSLPIQVNIGADSGNNNLPEPPKEKILELIAYLEQFTKVKQKTNLKRLLK
jgi:DNA repair photolyase